MYEALSFERRTQRLADHQGILAGMREGWKASLLFSADDFMTEFRESITSSISFVELLDYIGTGNISPGALEASEEERNIAVLRRRKPVSFGSRRLRKTIIFNKEHNKRVVR